MSLACRVLGHKPGRGWLVERIKGTVFTFERWTHVCGRCGRILTVEWDSATGDQT